VLCCWLHLLVVLVLAVGNIAFGTPEESLRRLFEQIGPVKSFRLVLDKDTGQPRGYGFCEYFEEKHAVVAINSLDQREINGRKLNVDTTEGSEVNEEDGPYAAKISVETKKEIENALRKLTMSEIYDVVSEMKMLIQRDREHALNLLKAKPVLAQALLTAQMMLGMAQISSQVASAGSGSKEQEGMDMDDEAQQLYQQLMALTPDQVNELPPEARAKYEEIRRAGGFAQ